MHLHQLFTPTSSTALHADVMSVVLVMHHFMTIRDKKFLININRFALIISMKENVCENYL